MYETKLQFTLLKFWGNLDFLQNCSKIWMNITYYLVLCLFPCVMMSCPLSTNLSQNNVVYY